MDSGTYSLLLQESIFRKEYKTGKRIHGQMVSVGFNPNEYLKTKLLILYAKSGDIESAHILFDKLLLKNVTPWNAMIAGYVQKGLEDVGLDLFCEMRCCGLLPDQYTFASVLRACASLATLEHGKKAHALLIKRKIKENVVVTSALVDMYFKCSSVSDGKKVFDKCSNRNVITWTALICGYGHHGKVTEVLNLFNKMINEGYKPNYVTFLAVLCACGHGGLVDEGWEYFHSMTRDYGILPRAQHYTAMVDVLGRAGRIQEAYEFVLKSPCKYHSVIWGSLLEACKIYGKMDLIKPALQQYFELEPENAGKYVVLSNAFASFGLWKNVAEIRGAMRYSGMIKEPGYSRIEVQREVHYFFIGDKSHKQSEAILEMVGYLTCSLKDAGYIPDFVDG